MFLDVTSDDLDKTGHIKINYPLFKNKKKNHYHKREMKATWSDDLDSSSSDKE